MRKLASLLVPLCLLACDSEKDEKQEAPRMNRLANEKSAYLRQHATNPVDWYPWGEEAFARAKAEDKPIFLSIGYSSCHWCHVMEHESFEDEEVARFLNEHFVSIKVDREERPDVDEVYMQAAMRLMRGGGGWPLSVWLTPAGKPFAAGTYFPKEPRMGMPGFLDVLGKIVEAWKDPEVRKRIDATGDQVAELVQAVYDMEDPAPIGEEEYKSAREMAELGFDREFGGFASPPAYQPKFPSPSSLEMLLRWALRKDDERALEMVVFTLRKMALGGIHDHVGGGFHRYSVTRDWLVPHFEKMLYDNAQLLGLYAWAYLVTKEELFRKTARDIARWVQREMTDPQGGFYAAQDADDPGGPEGEGGFYVWDPQGVRAILDEKQAETVLARFGITEAGNWPERPGTTILQVVRTEGVDEEILRAALERMYVEREKRPKPMTDTKVIAGWNGLMISGFCKAYQILGDPGLLESARRTGRFLRETMTEKGRLHRRWAEGEAAHDAVLADYAYVIAAYLDLYESTFEEEWLREALRLNRTAVELFYDPKEGGFFFTAHDGERLLARGKPGFDNARPSGNGVMALNLLRIADMAGDLDAREKAFKTLEYFGAQVSQSALGYGAILNALDYRLAGGREIFIAGPPDDPATRALIEAVWKDPDPNRVLVLVTPGIAKLLPPAEGKAPLEGKPAAYVCRDFTCDAPVTDPEKLAPARPQSAAGSARSPR